MAKAADSLSVGLCASFVAFSTSCSALCSKVCRTSGCTVAGGFQWPSNRSSAAGLTIAATAQWSVHVPLHSVGAETMQRAMMRSLLGLGAVGATIMKPSGTYVLTCHRRYGNIILYARVGAGLALTMRTYVTHNVCHAVPALSKTLMRPSGDGFMLKSPRA